MGNTAFTRDPRNFGKQNRTGARVFYRGGSGRGELSERIRIEGFVRKISTLSPFTRPRPELCSKDIHGVEVLTAEDAEEDRINAFRPGLPDRPQALIGLCAGAFYFHEKKARRGFTEVTCPSFAHSAKEGQGNPWIQLRGL